MTFISPMLADKMPAGVTMERLEADKKWVAEEKFDGLRVGIRVTDNEYQAWSRLGNPKQFPPHIADQLVLLPDGYYDGELIMRGGHSWDVSAGVNSDDLELQLFDMVEVLGFSIAPYPLSERRKYLEVAAERLGGGQCPIAIVEQYPYGFRDRASAIWNAGGEGLIIKHQNSTYQIGQRSERWVKVKAILEASLTITGFSTGTRQNLLTVAELVDDAGVPCTVKIMNEDWVRRINDADLHGPNWKNYIGKRMEIEYQVKTADGHYRHPMMKRIAGAE